jgi:hypothetical protein
VPTWVTSTLPTIPPTVTQPAPVSTAVPIPVTTSALPALTTVVPRPTAYSLPNGSVGVHCSGPSTIALDFATPAPGSTVKVGNAGPEEIEVKFKGTDRESEFHAKCVGGALRVESG